MKRDNPLLFTNMDAIEELQKLRKNNNIMLGENGYELGLALSSAIRALEMQRPKKVKCGYTLNEEKIWGCPVCGRIYWEIDFIDNYCSSCGHKLEVQE